MKAELPGRVRAAADFILGKTKHRPSTAIVLGSGLSGLLDNFQGDLFSYADIPHFPQPTVAGHAGKLLVGPNAAIFAGRFHLYEGQAHDAVAFPVLVAAGLGAKRVILTNAAGGIADSLNPGDLCLISDHINFQGSNPLVGQNIDEFGPRFPDMSQVYSSALQDLACELDPGLPSGVYLAVLGPSYETPAEIRVFRTLGADLVGMSTVPEAIVARHRGLEVLGISVVTNKAAGLGKPGVSLSHAEVVETGRTAEKRLGKLLADLVERLQTDTSSK